MLRPGEAISELVLRPAFGRAITLPSDLSDGPIGLVCLGGLSTPDTREAVAALQEVSGQMSREGIRLVALTTSALDRVQDFVSRYHVLFPVVSDPQGDLRSSFGVACGGAKDMLRGIAREISRPARVLQTGRGWREPHAYAPAVCFVLGTDGTVSWAVEGLAFDAMVDAARLSPRAAQT